MNLAGRCIVVTRPQEQAQRLLLGIRAAGGDALLFPTLDILPVSDDAPLRQAAADLPSYQLALFISPSAVSHAWPVLTAQQSWPELLPVAAVGSGTARALQQRGLAKVILPEQQFDSEALLLCAELQHMAGQRVLLLRGNGGRELLAQTLHQRGAHVDSISCYQRVCPQTDTTPLLLRWEKRELHGIIITSSAGLHNLHAMLGAAAADLLAEVPLFVSHANVAATAQQLGAQNVVLTRQGDDALLHDMMLWLDRQAK